MSAATYPKPKPTMRDGTLNQPPSFFFFSVRGCASLWSSSTGMSAIATLLLMSVLEDYGATAPVLGRHRGVRTYQSAIRKSHLVAVPQSARPRPVFPQVG